VREPSKGISKRGGSGPLQGRAGQGGGGEGRGGEERREARIRQTQGADFAFRAGLSRVGGQASVASLQKRR
jgi:hypothetical protein